MVKFFKKFNKKKRLIKAEIKQFLNKLLINICCKSKRLSLLYYCFFNESLYPSSYKIINAVREFNLKTSDSWSNISSLVRNIHRIEKAFCIADSDRVFALDFIGETVDVFRHEVINNIDRDLQIILWASDILEEYFVKFSSVKDLADKSASFFETNKLISHLKGAANLKPYQANDIVKSNITLEEFEALSKQRKSVRFYDQSKQVENEKLSRAVNIALNTPTACNKFPLKFHFITDPIMVEVAKKIPYGITCFSDHIPVMCFLVADLSGYHRESGMLGTPYVDCGLVATNFMYALELQGLSSCPINWTHSMEKEKEVRKFLNLKAYESVSICFTIGYRKEDAKVCFSQRKALKNTIFIN